MSEDRTLLTADLHALADHANVLAGQTSSADVCHAANVLAGAARFAAEHPNSDLAPVFAAQAAYDALAEQPTVAWVLQPDSTFQPAVAVRRLVWPGTSEVTYADGSTARTANANVRAADNIDLPWRLA